MRNATTQDIEMVIELFITSDRMFTGYDITKQIRVNGLHVMHAEVKDVLSKYNWKRNYKRTLNTDINAFIYHPTKADPTEYDYVAGVNLKTSAPVAHVVTSTITKTPSSDLLDKRGRYSVSGVYVKSCGFKAYTKVKFIFSKDCITIVETKNDTDKNATVDIKNNIRIHRRQFENAFNRVPARNELKIQTNQFNNAIKIFI